MQSQKKRVVTGLALALCLASVQLFGQPEARAYGGVFEHARDHRQVYYRTTAWTPFGAFEAVKDQVVRLGKGSGVDRLSYRPAWFGLHPTKVIIEVSGSRGAVNSFEASVKRLLLP